MKITLGPGAIVAAAFIGPGTIATAAAAGDLKQLGALDGVAEGGRAAFANHSPFLSWARNFNGNFL